MCWKKKKFIPHCSFFDCMEFEHNDVKEHTCEECKYWADTEEKAEWLEKHKWEI